MRATSVSAMATIAFATSSAVAGITYNETVDGDLSGDRFNPTALALEEGVNTITMRVVQSDAPGGDRDYFTFNVGAGLRMDSVNLVGSTLPEGGFDATAFVGLDTGDTFDFDPVTFTGSLSGFVLTTPDLIGTDILPQLNTESGDPVPSPPGDYSFWVQQTGDDLTEVTLEIVITPAPAGVGVFALGGLVAARRRRV